jgi:WD40 repeat protein
MRKVSERAPPEFVAVAIALAQQNRRRRIAIRDAFNVHGQLESLRFKRVKHKIEKLHGKPNQYPGRFTIQNQRVSPKTSGNFRLVSAVFSPDGAGIITSSDNEAWVWDAVTGHPVGKPLIGSSRLEGAVFSPDGSRIVAAFSRGSALQWDAVTREPIGKPLIGHEEKVRSAAYSPDGKRIVTASLDGTVRLWDTETGKQIGEPFRGHEDAVNSAAFSPDGTRVVTASRDKTARLWDAVTGQPIGEPFRGHEDAVNSAAFSPDGKRIVTASSDKTARVWDIPTDTQDLVSRAKASIPRCLTLEQRKAFFLPSEPPAWCIEMAKWPYDKPLWRQWLADKRAGKNPPLLPYYAR